MPTTTTPVKGSVRLTFTKGKIPVLAVRRILKSGKCLLTMYILEEIAVHPGVGKSGWRLNKIDMQSGKVSGSYDVLITLDGWETCDCRDYLARSRCCKHCAAIRAVAPLLAALEPRENR